MKNRGMRVYMNNTKGMISGERPKQVQKAVRWPCGPVVLVVIQYSVLAVGSVYTTSTVYSGIKGSMFKVMKSFTCKGCLNPVTSTGGTSVDLEVVDKFCYLGDMLSVDGDADAAVDATILVGWNKFMHHCLPMRIYH